MHRLPVVLVPLFLALLTMMGLTYCAAPGTTYERGAFRPPPPAPARAGVGAPTYDPQAKPLSPQPNPRPKRVLPPTPGGGPGLWASSEPGGAPTVEVFREPIPAPEDPKERSLVLWCREHALREFGQDAFKQKTPEWRRCAAATVLSACLEAEAKRLGQKLADNAARHYEPQRMETARRANAQMGGIKTLLCDGRTDQDTDTAESVMRRRILGLPLGAR